MEEMKKKWYQSAVLMWVALIFFFPVGLFLLWKYSTYSKKGKIIITAIIVILAIWGMSGNKNNSNTTNAPQQVTSSSSASSASSSASNKKEQKKEEPAVPVEYKSALKKAQIYGTTMHMSKAGIYQQLTADEGEQFSPEAAKYAVDNLKIDYKNEALKKAKIYQSEQAMSPKAIYQQLISEYGEQFTPEEAQYAVDNLNK